MDKKKLIRSFIIKAVIVFVIWQILYQGFVKPDGRVDDWLTEAVSESTVFGLILVGFDSYQKDNVIYINGEQSVMVGDACNGLELFALFAGFLIAFPGKFWSKVVYSGIGILVIAFANVIREMLLAINYNYFRASFELNHKYTYALAVYALVFVIWMHWLNRYSVVAKAKATGA